MPEIDLKAILNDPKRRKPLLIAGAVGIGAGLFVLYRNRGNVSLPASSVNDQYNVTPGGPLGGEGGLEGPGGAGTDALAGDSGQAVDQSFFDQLLGVLGAQQQQLQTDLASGLEGLYANQQVLSDQLASVGSYGAAGGGGEVFYAPAPASYDYGAAAAYQPQASDFGGYAYAPETGFQVQGDTSPATTGLADALFGSGSTAFQGSTPAKSPAKPLASALSSILGNDNPFASAVNQPVKQFAVSSRSPQAAAPITGYTPAGVLGSKVTTIQQAQVKPASLFQSGKVSQPAPTYATVVRSLSTPPKPVTPAPVKKIESAAKTVVATAPSARTRKV